MRKENEEEENLAASEASVQKSLLLMLADAARSKFPENLKQILKGGRFSPE